MSTIKPPTALQHDFHLFKTINSSILLLSNSEQDYHHLEIPPQLHFSLLPSTVRVLNKNPKQWSVKAKIIDYTRLSETVRCSIAYKKEPIKNKGEEKDE